MDISRIRKLFLIMNMPDISNAANKISLRSGNALTESTKTLAGKCENIRSGAINRVTNAGIDDMLSSSSNVANIIPHSSSSNFHFWRDSARRNERLFNIF